MYFNKINILKITSNLKYGITPIFIKSIQQVYTNKKQNKNTKNIKAIFVNYNLIII